MLCEELYWLNGIYERPHEEIVKSQQNGYYILEPALKLNFQHDNNIK